MFVIYMLQGVVPATIGVLDGQVKVGLSKSELSRLADPSVKKIKISRRDFPYVIANVCIPTLREYY